MDRYESSAEAVAARRRWYDTVVNASRHTPDSFRQQAYEAAAIVDALDNDPVSALDDLQTRRFVSRLSRIGFVKSYYDAMTMPQYAKYANSSRASLPLWLQPQFLKANNLLDWPEKPSSPEAIDAAYASFLRRNGLQLMVRNEYGEYYSSKVPYRSVPPTLFFKMYVEGRALETALQDGRLDQAYARFVKDPSGINNLKLHNSNRLVLYFRSPIVTAAPYVEDVLSKHHVPYRGPAQDVDRVKAGRARPILDVNGSNDNALADNPYHWDKYNTHPYQPQAFFDTYLRQCVLYGKSPVDPYRTAFITMYMSPGDPRLSDSAYMQEANQQAAPYPLVVHPTPRFPLPLARPAP